jgi:hypothetical protein
LNHTSSPFSVFLNCFFGIHEAKSTKNWFLLIVGYPTGYKGWSSKLPSRRNPVDINIIIYPNFSIPTHNRVDSQFTIVDLRGTFEEK